MEITWCPYSPTILKNALSLVLQIFLYFEAFECNTISEPQGRPGINDTRGNLLQERSFKAFCPVPCDTLPQAWDKLLQKILIEKNQFSKKPFQDLFAYECSYFAFVDKVCFKIKIVWVYIYLNFYPRKTVTDSPNLPYGLANQ